jgi:hypothetical protein
MVALVNARSVISSVQLGFGQSGTPGIGVTSGLVTTANGVLPFLISSSGILCEPDTVQHLIGHHPLSHCQAQYHQSALTPITL